MSQQVPILLINLDRDADRLAVMAKRLADQGLRFVRHAATAGDRMTDAEQRALCPTRRVWWRSFPFTPGEIGCYASHLAALRRIAEGSAPVACVVEDDIELLSDEFAAILTSAGPLPDELGLVKLEGSPHRLPRLGLPVGKIAGHTVTIYALPAWRTGAYLVSRTAARKLIANLDRMQGPIDQVLFEPWRTGVMVGEIRPFPATQTSSSRIDPNGGRRHRDVRQWPFKLQRFLRGHLWLIGHLPQLLGRRGASRRTAAAVR